MSVFFFPQSAARLPCTDALSTDVLITVSSTELCCSEVTEAAAEVEGEAGKTANAATKANTAAEEEEEAPEAAAAATEEEAAAATED